MTNGDTVYILGNVVLRGKNERLIALVARLKGHKILVRGNHDDLSDYRYSQLFEDYVVVRNSTRLDGSKFYDANNEC